MADITFKGPALPFVLGGTGSFTVHLGTTAPNDPLPKEPNAVLDITTSASTSAPVALGAAGAWTLSLKTNSSVKLNAVWPQNDALVKQYGLSSFFGAHQDRVVLALTIGASAEAKFSGEFRYSLLTASANLDASTDGSFSYTAGFAASTTTAEAVGSFFKQVTLPSALDRAPADGEVLRFQYGGYLAFGASLAAGYEMKGTPSINVSDLVLSESYALSVVGKIGFTAQLGGFFGVEIRQARDPLSHALLPGWARITVKKTRASEYTFAADASVNATSNLKGLPEAPNEFLGALLGVNVKNWLNLVDDVRDVTDFDKLLTKVDTLGLGFLSDWLGQKLDPGTLQALVDKVQKFAEAYENVDDTLITALDRYFDKITAPDLGNDIGDALGRLAKLPSWDDLKGDVDPLVWTLVTQLTDGDPLGWIAGKAVGALQERAKALIDFGQSAAHVQLRAFISLAKSKFGLDPLVAKLKDIKTPDDLNSVAGQALGGFAQRLLGDDISKLQKSSLGGVLTRIHTVLDHVNEFETKVYAKITEAAKQTFTFNLHAEYRRSEDNEALIDIAINAATSDGKALLHAASLGDFTKALTSYQPDLVKIYQGNLTHNLVKASSLAVNVIGWHLNWHYQSLERLILHTDQQIVPDDNGGLTVYTTIDLTKDSDRKRNQQRAYTNLLLRFFGESHGAIQPDASANPATAQYLIDAITRVNAQYQLGFVDDKTSLKELSYYLSFAKDFGLTDQATQVSTIATLLPTQGADNFGAISATYDVRYQSSGLRKLFDRQLDENAVRRVIRKVILTSYVRAGGNQARVGWAYWTKSVYDFWKMHEQPARGSFVSAAPRQFDAIEPSPFADITAPSSVIIPPEQQPALGMLYQIEDLFIRGLLALETLIVDAGHGIRISPKQFENRLGDIGSALTLLDSYGESVNTTFAVFDSLLQAVGGAQRASSLTLNSQVGGRQVSKVLVSPPSA